MRPLQVQARALGDPTRHGIFRYLADADTSVDVAELTEHFGLNHNAIRQHLTKLVEADLVVETSAAPSGRGRPRLFYSINPTSESRWGVVGPYERLSMLLAEVVKSGDAPVEVGRRAGLRLRRITEPSQDPIAGLMDQMARQGFEPSISHEGDVIDVALLACPFASAALTDPDTICDLHLGLAQGIAEAVGGITIDELVPKDPHHANCRMRCRINEPVPPS